MIKRLYELLLYAIYIAGGKKPFSTGYRSYKEIKTQKILNNHGFDVENLPSGYGFRIDERIVEYPWLFSRLPAESGCLLDAGSVLNFPYLLDHKSIRNKKVFISTLAPEKNAYWNRGISYVYEDLRQACYKNDCFDWIVSLSTVEHIGLDNTLLYTEDITKNENRPYEYIKVIKEFNRVLKPGGVLYLSIPFGAYKNHQWLQVFDSLMIDRVIDAFKPSSLKKNYFRYFPDGWQVADEKSAQDATYFDMHSQKKLESDFAAAARAVICLEMMK